MTNPENGSRFNREFTPDDLAIVNLGYWDPNAEDDTEPAASAPVESAVAPAVEPVAENREPVTAEPAEPDAEPAGEPEEPETAEAPDTPEAPQEPAPSAEKSPVKILAGGPSTAPSVAVDPDAEFSRVEAIPGGVKSAIEAILAVAEAPVSVRELSVALIVSEWAVEHALDQLYREYNGEETEYGEEGISPEPRGFQLRRIAGGWKLYARDDFAPWVARFVTRSKSATLSKPAYETLAVIAYRQPVTRARVASIRGVNADAAIRQLLQRQLIREAGREIGTGATLYETTELLLAKLGLDSLEELPALAPFLPDDTEAAVLAEGND